MDTVYKNIKKLREELGMSQEELANKLGYKSRSSINKIELGINDLPQSKIREFAKVLNTSVSGLMGFEVITDNTETLNTISNILEKENYKLGNTDKYDRIEILQDNKLIDTISIGDLIRNYDLCKHNNPIQASCIIDKPYPTNILPIRTHKIPLLGTIAAGIPILATEDCEQYIEVGDSVKCDFCLRVQGDSMIDARINDGDIVFIKKQSDVENGEIAAVIVDDEATLKRIYKGKGFITLVPANPKYKPMTFTESDALSVVILGKAVAFQSKVI